MKKRKVAVLFGGNSTEHEVSKLSGGTIIEALGEMPEKYEVLPMYIPADGGFDYNALRTADVVFPAMHGKNGEDGSVQGFCQLYGLPVVGCGILSSALCLDKPVSKRLTSAIQGLCQVPFIEFFSDEQAETRIIEEIGFPCFIKPVNTGSSLGMSKVTGREALRGAIKTAAKHDRRIMAEKFLAARELEVGVIGNARPIVSGVGEIVTRQGFYDYSAKYTEGGAEVIVPADIDKDTTAKVREFSLLIYKALYCQGMARIDFFLEESTGRIFFNEANTIPGFTPTSMFHRLFAETGIDLSALCGKLVELAIEAAGE